MESNPEPAEGQVPAGDYEPVPESVPEESVVDDTSPKSNIEIAKEVIAGHWGRGNDRKQRLKDAGYNVQDIYMEMVDIFNK